MNKRQMTRLVNCILLLVLVGVMSTSLIGCGLEIPDKIIVTTGFGRQELFKLGSTSCNRSELMVYLLNLQNQYEEVYGDQIWGTEADGVSLADSVKSIALSQIAQVKAINLLAKDRGITLTEEEDELVVNIGTVYFDSLSQEEKAYCDIDKKTVIQMYREYAIAMKLYEKLIEDINPEISDDEARTITVEHILIKTYSVDEEGNVVKMDATQKAAAEDKAREALGLIKEEGREFEAVAEEYNEDDKLKYSFGKDEMDPVFEYAAFNLGMDEVSDIVETQYGFHIIKCISTFDREETEANKTKIVEKRRKAAFLKDYENYSKNLDRELNEEMWNDIELAADTSMTTSDFFARFEEAWSESHEYSNVLAN